MTTSRYCGRGCQVCRFHQVLVELGALYHETDHLIENECKVTVRVPSGALCVTKLKMDVVDARYRKRLGSNNMTRMCDFAVALAIEGVARYCAIELKSREPYLRDAAEQLREGLRAIVDYVVDGPLRPTLRAILVVGVMSPRLMRIARSRDGRLSISGREVLIELADCGGPLEI